MRKGFPTQPVNMQFKESIIIDICTKIIHDVINDKYDEKIINITHHPPGLVKVKP